MTGAEPSRAKRRCEAYGDVSANGQAVDNSGSTLQKLLQLYRQADLCDVHLQVGIHLFPSHKLILSMSSDVFKTMLTDAKWPEARKDRIVLIEDAECVQVFGEFLKYMYTGSIHLKTSSVLPVLTLADKYNIHDLGKVCKQYMASHCHDSTENLKVVSWLQYAILCNDGELETTLRRYIELNMNHVMGSADFVTMRLDTLEEVLHSERLVVHSEYSLFLGLKRWLIYNTTGVGHRGRQRPGRRAAARKTTLQVMSHLRLPLMKRAQLLALQADPFVKQHADFFAPKLHAALSLHTLAHCRNKGIVHPSLSSLHRYHHSLVNAHSKMVVRRNSDSNIICSNSEDRDLLDQAWLTFSSLRPYAQIMDPTLVNESVNCLNLDQPSLDQEWTQCTMLAADVSAHSSAARNSSVCRLLPGSSGGGSVLFAPRNYTCDDWSTCLTIEDLAAFPRYGSHTYFFSTPSSAVLGADRCGQGCHRQEESDDSTMLEWQAELYPKGVRFPRAKMIGIPKNYDIDEKCQEVVRLAVNSKTQHLQPCRVDISVLAVATGGRDGDSSEYIEALAHKTCIFDSDHTMHNIDNIVPLAELSCSRSRYLTQSVLSPGSQNKCFKVIIIIKPAS